MADPVSQPLERTLSQHSTTSLRSNRSTRSATLRARQLHSNLTSKSHRSGSLKRNNTQLASGPNSSSASSIAASDKSLTSFPSFSPETLSLDRFVDNDGTEDETRLKTARQEDLAARERRRASGSIVDSLTMASPSRQASSRGALFEDSPLPSSNVPGALHTATDEHILRLAARHGTPGLVRQIAHDLAERDAHISRLRRKADKRERALRKIIREMGIGSLDLEARLRAVEGEMSSEESEGGVKSMMSDAMEEELSDSLASRETAKAMNPADVEQGKGTMRGWKEYFLGSGTAKKTSRTSSRSGERQTQTVTRSQLSLGQRPSLQKDLFMPPDERPSGSRTSSMHSGMERKGSTSLASKALRLVAGGANSGSHQDSRGRASSGAARTSSASSTRAASTASNTVGRSNRAATIGGPKALMTMRKATPAPTGAKSQAQELWGTMVGSPPDPVRQESFGPVEMDAMHPPESQPPTLTHVYNNYANSEFLTDRFGFIYDQRRKKRQREAAQMAKHIRNGSRTEMINSGRSGISPNMLEDVPSPKSSVFSENRPGSPNSQETKDAEDRPKRWQDYLKIATFPTELLSHTPMGTSSLEVLEAPELPTPTSELGATSVLTSTSDLSSKSPGITPTESGLMPVASTTTALDNQVTIPSEPDSLPLASEDTEPVKLLLEQLSDVHDSLQRDKTVRWNDFLRKVRAERKREGDAAVAAAQAAAEARFERPAVILPETRVADGEMIGISSLGHKGKVGRAKWNEFRTLVLGGIPVALRAKVWGECSGANTLRIPGYYDSLLSGSDEADDPTVVSQIQMDIHRTLPDNIFFRSGPGVPKLSSILLAYSRRNPAIGYCQGMNLIVANLLLIMPSAEDAFWLLAAIVENILPNGYYDGSLRASRADQQVLRTFVGSVLPKLSAHLDELGVELEALTFQWFLSVFTDCLSAEALFRVWDVVLCSNTLSNTTGGNNGSYSTQKPHQGHPSTQAGQGSGNDGSTFLFQVALALLKLNEGNLLQCHTAAGVYTYINHHMTEHAISIDGLIQASEGLRRLVKREDVERKRMEAIESQGVQIMQSDDDVSSSDLRTEEPRPIQ